ncbi:MAG: asparagine synthase (glutamine-hydrolyzing) [Micavibrio sp.]|nr:asparagine synthase (glutamine-hydrolyzing) [Micavibrio sp.]
MCGIAGLWSIARSISAEKGEALVSAMADTLSHRGPDASGVWGEPESGLYVSHRRLSILDLSEAGAQPMSSHDGRYVIVFNGEIYNFADLKKQLPAEINWNGRSDTEILLEGLARLGVEKTLSIVKGMFAFALWDKQARTLTFARDHVGKKPIYIGFVGGALAFASELKALRPLVEAALPIDQKAFAQFNYFGFIPAPHTIYDGVYKLKPAHVLTLRESDLAAKDAGVILRKMTPFWQVEKRAEHEGADLKTLLKQAVADRMIADVPLGAFLSGGIDSSLVTAMMQEQSARAVKTYSIGFSDHQFDESRHAEKVAAHLGTDHTTYHVTEKETLDIIPQLPEIYDEPFADYSQIPTIALCREARKDTIVALSGDGGDEVFCGYKRYFMLKKLLDATKRMPRPAIAKLITIAGQDTYNALGLNGKRLHSIAGFLEEKSLESTILRTLSVNPDMPQPALGLNLSSDLTDLEKMMMIDTHFYLPDDILVKVDRASMAASLEIRSPLLDKDVIEYSWTRPIKEKIFADKGRGKKPLYDLLCTYVPEELVNRPKQGFTPPVARWLKNDLKDWADALVHADTGLYDTDVIGKMWNGFISEKVDNHSALWSVLMAQSWALKNKF